MGLDQIGEEGKEVPLWLCNDKVRSGIRSMLELHRAGEEDIILERDRRSMRLWYAEEWAIAETAIGSAGGGVILLLTEASWWTDLACTYVENPQEAYQFLRGRRRLIAVGKS